MRRPRHRTARDVAAADAFVVASLVGDVAELRRLSTSLLQEGPLSLSTCHTQLNFAALHAAAQAGHRDTVEFLVALGADPNAPDGRGRTPLHVATANCRLAVTRMPLSAGADRGRLDGSGLTANTALQAATHYTVRQGRAGSISRLLLTCVQEGCRPSPNPPFSAFVGAIGMVNGYASSTHSIFRNRLG